MKHQLAGKAFHSEFLAAVEKHCEQEISACYQCGKCSAGCPVFEDMAIAPNRVIRMVQLGLKEDALKNEMIWCCAGCSACTCRCPIGIDLARMMDTLRQMATHDGVPMPPDGARVFTFFQAFLDSVREFGRLSEVALMGSYNINSGRIMTNVVKAPWFLLKGKVGIIPHKIKRTDRLKRVFRRIEEIEGS
ncbi:MAG: heterodisulfide reductase subunit C [Kiritimatiellaeota bacterium]|nr:heterodisulfide reductase subunit C [Kiritimatiellota bacterium]